MTLIVEDGSIVPNANSYITVVEYSSWANSRYGSARNTLPADELSYESIILRATDYFEAQPLIGSKETYAQNMQFPRTGVTVDGFSIPSNVIPREVKLAIFELTYAEEQGVEQGGTTEAQVIEKTVGPITLKYASTGEETVIESASPALDKLLNTSGQAGAVGFTVSRA